MKKISEKEFLEMEKNGVTVVDFAADWCGPCKMLAPVLEQVSEELAGKADFYTLNVDECPALVEEYSITNIPAILVLKNGVKQEIQVGFQPKDSLTRLVEKYI